MKNPIMLLLPSVCALFAAEPQTLFAKDLDHGWYVAPVLKICTEYPWFNYFGVNAGWIVNHRFGLGAVAYAMTIEPAVSLGYGGVPADFEPNPDRLVHFINCWSAAVPFLIFIQAPAIGVAAMAMMTV